MATKAEREARARELIEEGRAQERAALERFKRGAGQTPSQAERRTRLKALASYRAATRLCPGLAEAWVLRMEAASFQGLGAEPRQCARQAAKLGPGDAYTLLWLSRFFALEERRAVLRRGLRLAARQPQARQMLELAWAGTWAEEGDFKVHVRELSRLVASRRAKNPALRTTELLELGKGHEALKDHGRAERAYRRAIDSAPTRDLKEHALRTLLLSCIHAGRIAQARQALGEYAAVASPQLARAFAGALDLLDGKPIPGALGFVDDAMAAHVDFFAGLFLLAAGRRAEARRWLARFAAPSFAKDKRNAAAFRWEIRKARELLRERS